MTKAGFFRSNLFMAAVLLALFAVNIYVTTTLRTRAGADALWTANAFSIAALLLLPRRWGLACAAACVLFQAGYSIHVGRPVLSAATFALINLGESVLGAFLVVRAGVARLTTPGRVARLIVFAILPAVICASLATGVASHLLDGKAVLEVFMRRVPAKLLGISLVLPAILLLARRSSVAMIEGRNWALGSYFLLIGLLSLALFSPINYLAMFMLFPAVTALGFRMGPKPVTLAMIGASMIIFPMSIMVAPGEMFHEKWRLSTQVVMTQAYVAMVFFTGLISALAARHQQRLRALFAAKSRSAMRARDRAQAASIAKTEFLATMSHEIRTPLNSIIGFSQVLDRRDDLSAEARRQIGLIERSGGALLTVVNDILDFSKVEAGRIALDPKPVMLAVACRDALAIVAEAAERKGLALSMTVEGDGDVAHVCDDHRLRQVLLNFLNNAVKFTDAGAVSLRLAILPEEAGDRVRISVTDTGLGIDTAAAEHLFQRFTQADSSISRTHGGTGLGLAICKGLVELMGGKVGVDSARGEGSTFWLEIVLPRAEALAALAVSEADEEGVCAHILLVDDHPMNRELGATVLGLLGCTYDLASDGREAIEAASARRYDAVLMDVHMPGVDGLAATRAIRALPGQAGLAPIIAMSADVLPEQVARCRAAGMNDSVGKPINIEKLHGVLTQWVGRDCHGTQQDQATAA